jgi:hypothetical protein
MDSIFSFAEHSIRNLYVSSLSFPASDSADVFSLQIWFAHKRVCGKNANPFRFPSLSSVEAAQAREFVSTPVPRGYTLADAIMGKNTDPKEKLDTTLVRSLSFLPLANI